MTRKRQLQRSEETRQLILSTAKEIISESGFEGLSIRKIVKHIDYSPSIIYHYFKDKDEIVDTLLKMGYQCIIQSLRAIEVDRSDPCAVIRVTFEKYIRASLASRNEYKAFMLRDDKATLEVTGILARGMSREKQTLKILCGNIQMGIDKGVFRKCDVELTAQVVWTSTFGLVMKLILEGDIDDEQVDRLIDQHFKMMFHGLMIEEN